eukprot:CAMPEP_0168538922 /NCGR_PEP_ID=MMETSP0405-20121227/21484_1 /TAXON_ID=498012 /ORGANISM="Trichosphaerium sp, Strain Am-I-7 wt" /LENGTH=540 /DNA_ID=CAMNT_0008568313 /DNA_START=41 /DNA_END=1660 /DNA_ORIENTATION=-
MGQQVPKIALEKFSEHEIEQLELNYRKLIARKKTGSRFHIRDNLKSTFTDRGLDRKEFKLYPELADALYAAFDTEKTGSIDFQHFAAGMALCSKGYNHEKYNLLFNMFDKDCSGSIDVKELEALFSSTLFATDKIVKAAVETFEQQNENTYLEALYDYTASSANEMSFKKNDILVLHKKFDNVWWWAQSGSTKGYVPSNYVKIVEDNASIKDRIPKRAGASNLDLKTTAKKLAQKVMKEADGNNSQQISREEWKTWAATSYEVSIMLKEFDHFELPIPGSFAISSPTQFAHRTHLSGSGNFGVDELPAEWKDLLKQAGISKKEAQDPEVQKMVLGIVAEHVPNAKENSQAKKRPTAEHGTSTPPTVPPKRHKPLPKPGKPHKPVKPNRKPRPPPKRPESKPKYKPEPNLTTTGPPPPPPVPQPVAKVEPVATTSPTPAAPKRPAVGGFLAEIQTGKKLHHTEVNEDKPEPTDSNPLLAGIKNFSKKKLVHVDPEDADLKQLDDQQLNGLAGLLSKAIASRREFMTESTNNADEDEDDEEW